MLTRPSSAKPMSSNSRADAGGVAGRSKRLRPDGAREEYDVRHVLGFLRSRGVCPQAVVSSTAAEDLVAAFARHMLERRGLASPTIERYTIAARQFLKNRFGDGAVDMRSVVASDIIDFIRGQSAHLRGHPASSASSPQ